LINTAKVNFYTTAIIWTIVVIICILIAREEAKYQIRMAIDKAEKEGFDKGYMLGKALKEANYVGIYF